MEKLIKLWQSTGLYHLEPGQVELPRQNEVAAG